MRISLNGIAFIKDNEGYSNKAYKDTAGIWTIGYGHTGDNVTSTSKVTPVLASAYLREDIYTAEKALAGFKLNQNQYDALVSFVYNIGVDAFKDSTMRKFLVKGDFDLASTQFQRWNKVTKGGIKIVDKGLTNRRAREKELFEKPVEKRI